MRRLRKDSSLSFTRFPSEPTRDPTTWKPVYSGLETFTATGTLEPLSDSDIATLLPEGKRVNRAYRFFTSTPLSDGKDSGPLLRADETTISGETFVVFDKGDYSLTSRKRMKHYEAILIKETPKES